MSDFFIWLGLFVFFGLAGYCLSFAFDDVIEYLWPWE